MTSTTTESPIALTLPRQHRGRPTDPTKGDQRRRMTLTLGQIAPELLLVADAPDYLSATAKRFWDDAVKKNKQRVADGYEPIIMNHEAWCLEMAADAFANRESVRERAKVALAKLKASSQSLVDGMDAGEWRDYERDAERQFEKLRKACGFDLPKRKAIER